MIRVAACAALIFITEKAASLQLPVPTAAQTTSVKARSPTRQPPPETFRVRGVEGVHCESRESLAAQVVPQVPELASWENWYRAPRVLTNGHVHTIAAFQFRATRACQYHRQLLGTPDGGTLALDLLVAIERREPGYISRNPTSHAGECESKTVFVDSPPPRDNERPFLLLVSGLGGGSQDTYVRSMAAQAAERGWQVGVLNMRGCGGSPITSPRFFSAHRGSTDDVRLAVQHIRNSRLTSGTKVAVLGWSNGGTIVNNLISEQATTHSFSGNHHVDAGACLASPLDMVASAENLRRPFHSKVYDRNIARSLATKFAAARDLFEAPPPLSYTNSGTYETPESGGFFGRMMALSRDVQAPRRVPRWEGLADGDGGVAGTFVVDVEAAAGAQTIREIDAALTAPCFGFSSVDEYYAYASSGPRLKDARVPLFVLSAFDDPIAVGKAIPFNAAKENPKHVVLAVTATGGHLGWCDHDDPWGSPKWVEGASLGFLEASLELAEPGSGVCAAPTPGCLQFDVTD